MAHDPEWHAKYLCLENAEREARAIYWAARWKATRKGATMASKAACEQALTDFRFISKAMFDFEMGGTRVVDISTLPPLEWAKALRS
jgi:hypothetical protein